MKIALLGGTFNPIHTDHINIIKHCKYNLKFDEVWIVINYKKFFATTPSTPLKYRQYDATPEDRVNMVKIATAGLDYVKVITYELEPTKEAKNHFTYVTVTRIQKEFPHHKFTFVIGSDILATLPRWYKIKKLLKLISFIVIVREKGLETTFDYKFRFKKSALETSVKISSSEIRNGENLHQEIPDVNNYITDHELYIYDRLKAHLPIRHISYCFEIGWANAKSATLIGADEHEAFLAGVYHDITRYWLIHEQKKLIKGYASKKDWLELDENNTERLSALASKIFIEKHLMIKNPNILKAILEQRDVNGRKWN